ncbi:MAG: DNA-binding protein [Planctomycetes bacterium]|nr:DNA-binding protein [Planctomycetota bacterium]
MDRLFLDANVLFSAAYMPKSALLELWGLNATLITSEYAALEAKVNLEEARPAQLKPLDKLLESLEVMDLPSGKIQMPAGINLAAKDHPILLAALEANASHLLTGDKAHFGPLFGIMVKGVLILRPGDYLRGLRKS